MKLRRIVRTKYALHFVFATIMLNFLMFGILIPGHLPFEPFGEPDPTVIFMPLIIDGFVAIFWFRNWVLLITDKVITRLGIVRVHSEDSVATFDPLDYVHFNKIENLSPLALNDLYDLVWEKHGRGTQPKEKHMKEVLMPKILEFRDREYKNYLGGRTFSEVAGKKEMLADGPNNYDILVHGVMLQECREDGGNRLFGRRGSRISGNAVLTTPIGMVRQQGTDSINYCEVESWWGIDLFGFEMKVPKQSNDSKTPIDDLTNQIELELELELGDLQDEYENIKFQGLPHYIFLGMMAHNPWFRPGEHMVLWGTEPVPECVRALIEDNKDVTDHKELEKRPRWAFGFPANVIDINPKARIQYIEYNTSEEVKSIKKISDNYAVVKKIEEKAAGKDGESPTLPIVDDNGDDDK